MSIKDEANFIEDTNFSVCAKVNTPLGEETVRITLEWEKDPRNAVIGLAKVVKNDDIMAALFAEATKMAYGDDGWDDDEEEDEE